MAGEEDTSISLVGKLYRYYLHGIVLSIVMTAFLPVLLFVSMFLAFGFGSLSTNDFLPPGANSPLLTGFIDVNLGSILLILLVAVYGFLNLFLTKVIWKEEQWTNWTRRIGIGAILLVCSLSYHITIFFPLLMGGYSSLFAMIPTLTIFALLDGVIGKQLTIYLQ